MDSFRFKNNGEPGPNKSGRSGSMTESRNADKSCSVILYESISATQKVLEFFKLVLHCSLIEYVKSEGLIVPRK